VYEEADFVQELKLYEWTMLDWIYEEMMQVLRLMKLGWQMTCSIRFMFRSTCLFVCLILTPIELFVTNLV
jgi:hypothetical protein